MALRAVVTNLIAATPQINFSYYSEAVLLIGRKNRLLRFPGRHGKLMTLLRYRSKSKSYMIERYLRFEGGFAATEKAARSLRAAASVSAHCFKVFVARDIAFEWDNSHFI